MYTAMVNLQNRNSIFIVIQNATGDKISVVLIIDFNFKKRINVIGYN